MSSLAEILECAQRSGQRVVVIGLGITGVESARFLRARGLKVCVIEKVIEERFRSSSKFATAMDQLRESGVEVLFGVDGERIAPHLNGAALVVVSPGVPLESAIIGSIKRHGIPYISELELGIQLHTGPIVVVTGSNGKSTTSALIDHMLRCGGISSRLCGNIGLPVLSAVARPSGDTLVVEASSYQLEACTVLKPDVSVVLNISENHLERHGSLERYASAKSRAIRLQSEREMSILNVDDPMVREISRSCRARRAVFGSASEAELRALSSIWARVPAGDGVGDSIVVSIADAREEYQTDRVKLLGRHNRYNMAAAIVAARRLGVSSNAIQEALETFEPLEHRLEIVSREEGRIIINDAKSTTVAASLAALATVFSTFPNLPVTLMIGGLSKAGSWQPLLAMIRARHGSFARVVCFGRDGGLLASHCRSVGIEPVVATSLREATREALESVRNGGVALLSPGCASFDEFVDFEHRGAEFKRYVRESLGEHGGASV